MLNRISKVDTLSVKTHAFSSLVNIGDIGYADADSYVFALQRGRASFAGKEADYIDFPVFHYSTVYLPATEPVYTSFTHQKPFITVGSINVIGVTVSSIIEIGHIGHAEMITRIHHTRELGSNSSKGKNTTE